MEKDGTTEGQIHTGDDDFEGDDDPGGDVGIGGGHMQETSLLAIIQSQTSIEEDIHGRLAIELAKRAKIFSDQMEDD